MAQDSGMLVYCGQVPDKRTVKMPDFRNLDRLQAAKAAGKLGIRILSTGNPGMEAGIVAAGQSIAPQTPFPVGTAVTLEFTDKTVRD